MNDTNSDSGYCEETHVFSVFVGSDKEDSLGVMLVYSRAPPSVIMEACNTVLDAIKILPPDEMKDTIVIRYVGLTLCNGCRTCLYGHIMDRDTRTMCAAPEHIFRICKNPSYGVWRYKEYIAGGIP